jgi:antitoxin StbD
VRLHDLGHFAATRLLTAGIDLRTVAGRLGHSKASTTLNVYASFVPDADQRAAQAISRLLGRTARRSVPVPESRRKYVQVLDSILAMAPTRPAEVLPTTEVRAKLSQIAAHFERHGATAEPVTFGSHRRPQGVIIPWELWLEILPAIEDRLDALEARERLETTGSERITIDEAAERLGRDPRRYR